MPPRDRRSTHRNVFLRSMSGWRQISSPEREDQKHRPRLCHRCRASKSVPQWADKVNNLRVNNQRLTQPRLLLDNARIALGPINLVHGVEPPGRPGRGSAADSRRGFQLMRPTRIGWRLLTITGRQGWINRAGALMELHKQIHRADIFRTDRKKCGGRYRA